jgi:putative transposase
MQALNGYANDIAEGDKYFKLLYSQTRQDIWIRVMRAYQNFFRRCKDKSGKNGFPKFKSHDKYRSITYP